MLDWVVQGTPMNQASLRTIIPIVLSWVHSSFGSTVVRPYSIEMATHSFNSLKQDESAFTFSCCQQRPSPTFMRPVVLRLESFIGILIQAMSTWARCPRLLDSHTLLWFVLDNARTVCSSLPCCPKQPSPFVFSTSHTPFPIASTANVNLSKLETIMPQGPNCFVTDLSWLWKVIIRGTHVCKCKKKLKSILLVQNYIRDAHLCSNKLNAVVLLVLMLWYNQRRVYCHVSCVHLYPSPRWLIVVFVILFSPFPPKIKFCLSFRTSCLCDTGFATMPLSLPTPPCM